MVLQLTDNLWELKLDTTFSANISQHLIGEFINPFIIINVTSDDTLSAWKQAGSVGQAIAFEGNIAYGEVTELTLKTFTLLQFPLLSGNSYKLYYFPLPRLVNVKIKVWEYKGKTVETSIAQLIDAINVSATLNINQSSITEIVNTLEQSGNLNVDLSAIEADINCLKDDLSLIKNALGIKPVIEATAEQIEFFLFN